MTDTGRIIRGHSIERTSPKGERFVGTCWQCGGSGLTLSDMSRACRQRRVAVGVGMMRTPKGASRPTTQQEKTT